MDDAKYSVNIAEVCERRALAETLHYLERYGLGTAKVAAYAISELSCRISERTTPPPLPPRPADALASGGIPHPSFYDLPVPPPRLEHPPPLAGRFHGNDWINSSYAGWCRRYLMEQFSHEQMYLTTSRFTCQCGAVLVGVDSCIRHFWGEHPDWEREYSVTATLARRDHIDRCRSCRAKQTTSFGRFLAPVPRVYNRASTWRLAAAHVGAAGQHPFSQQHLNDAGVTSCCPVPAAPAIGSQLPSGGGEVPQSHPPPDSAVGSRCGRRHPAAESDPAVATAAGAGGACASGARQGGPPTGTVVSTAAAIHAVTRVALPTAPLPPVCIPGTRSAFDLEEVVCGFLHERGIITSIAHAAGFIPRHRSGLVREHELAGKTFGCVICAAAGRHLFRAPYRSRRAFFSHLENDHPADVAEAGSQVIRWAYHGLTDRACSYRPRSSPAAAGGAVAAAAGASAATSSGVSPTARSDDGGDGDSIDDEEDEAGEDVDEERCDGGGAVPHGDSAADAIPPPPRRVPFGLRGTSGVHSPPAADDGTAAGGSSDDDDTMIIQRRLRRVHAARPPGRLAAIRRARRIASPTHRARSTAVDGTVASIVSDGRDGGGGGGGDVPEEDMCDVCGVPWRLCECCPGAP